VQDSFVFGGKLATAVGGTGQCCIISGGEVLYNVTWGRGVENSGIFVTIMTAPCDRRRNVSEDEVLRFWAAAKRAKWRRIGAPNRTVFKELFVRKFAAWHRPRAAANEEFIYLQRQHQQTREHARHHYCPPNSRIPL